MNPGRLATIALAVFALLALTLGVYVGGYYALGEEGHIGNIIARNYRYNWQRDMFKPAAKAESLITGCEVQTVCWDQQD